MSVQTIEFLEECEMIIEPNMDLKNFVLKNVNIKGDQLDKEEVITLVIE